MINSVAIIIGKKEKRSFNRFTFPLLSRPTATYTYMAALNSEKIQKVYLFSSSPELVELCSSFEGISLLQREEKESFLTDDIKEALGQISSDLGRIPRFITVLLANSPCITSEMLDEAISELEDDESKDSVVSVMKRKEFSPDRILTLFDDKLATSKIFSEKEDDIYFLDKRVFCLKSENITQSDYHNNYFESLLGKNVIPVIQNEGIWDIDYVWQVPIMERWLKQNGFTETTTPYQPGTSITVGQPKPSVSGDKLKVLISTVPFGIIDPKPLIQLQELDNVEYVINPIGRKLKEEELRELIVDYDILIAGTEPITSKVLENAKKLKLISRVGIGLDSVDLNDARKRGIIVSYTPDAPSAAVAELTMGHMLNLMRHLPIIDRKMRSGIWQRITGERIANKVIGIIGTGRIGRRVLQHLQGFNPQEILVNDLNPQHDMYEMYHAKHVGKQEIYERCDIISLHVPLTGITKSMIALDEMRQMKKEVVLINTSRGGIINEEALYTALKEKVISGAAIDVFDHEPYTGPLIELDNCFISCHMGSMTSDCRAQMEIQATEEAIRYIKKEELQLTAPEFEYQNQLNFG